MRGEALTFLICPDCDGELSLEGSVAPKADDHILRGKLNCQGCASNFTIRNGVPVLLPVKMAGVRFPRSGVALAPRIQRDGAGDCGAQQSGGGVGAQFSRS
jgi:uncharacterized protein YbaR (Trm112 family)